jgi:UDP-N-acetylglucosamine transferase subunit ALG13
MIFVTVGTSEDRFDRLMTAVGALERTERLLVQTGASDVRPAGATCLDFLPYDELVEYVRAARVVVTHAGVGTVLTALLAGKRPVVVPRLRRLGEAVDDHQLAFARRLAGAGLVTLVEDVSELGAAVADTAALQTTFRGGGGRLAQELATLIELETGAPPAPVELPHAA